MQRAISRKRLILFSIAAKMVGKKKEIRATEWLVVEQGACLRDMNSTRLNNGLELWHHRARFESNIGKRKGKIRVFRRVELKAQERVRKITMQCYRKDRKWIGERGGQRSRFDRIWKEDEVRRDWDVKRASPWFIFITLIRSKLQSRLPDPLPAT